MYLLSIERRVARIAVLFVIGDCLGMDGMAKLVRDKRNTKSGATENLAQLSFLLHRYAVHRNNEFFLIDIEAAPGRRFLSEFHSAAASLFLSRVRFRGLELVYQ